MALCHVCAMLSLMFAHVWPYVGPCSPHLGRCWAYVGLVGPSSPHLGRCWAYVGRHLGRCWPDLGPCWPYLGNMLAHATHILADVGLMLAQVCLCFGLMLAHVARILADVGPMLATMPSRCQIFRSGPPPKTQNHEKPRVFLRRQDETWRRRRPRNPVKNDVF